MPNDRAKSMAAMLTEEAAALPDTPVAFPPRREAAPAAPAKAATAPPAAPARRRQPPRATSGLTESQTPKWQRLERKELRLRADQLDELARLRRTLNRQRGGEGERITENTLIRVAVDLLLKQADALRGSTEDELRNSVTS
jgi:hypothetical protein